MSVCGKARADIPRIVRAVGGKNRAALRGYAGAFARWSHKITFQAHDAQLANYLADAGIDVSLLTTPDGTAYIHKAGVALGKVNGYCKYDAS
jgi:hypothetical protein